MEQTRERERERERERRESDAGEKVRVREREGCAWKSAGLQEQSGSGEERREGRGERVENRAKRGKRKKEKQRMDGKVGTTDVAGACTELLLRHGAFYSRYLLVG